MALQSLIRWLLPKDDRFFTILEEHASVMAEAARDMAKLRLGNGSAAEALDRIHTLEHRGDDLVRALTMALEETFVTPIDREDLHNLSTQLDNVLDYLYAAANAFVTYQVHEKTPAMQEMLRLLCDATAALSEAVPSLRLHHYEKIAPARIQVINLEKEHDAVYHAALGKLYGDPDIDAKELLRQQAVLNALEDAMDSCQDAADVLENLAVKHA